MGESPTITLYIVKSFDNISLNICIMYCAKGNFRSDELSYTRRQLTNMYNVVPHSLFIDVTSEM